MANWFDKTWIGKIIEFENPLCWKVVEKLCEHETRFYQEEFEQSKFYSESCCIFVCEDTKDSTRAIMKIRMQIPYIGAELNPPEIRAPQALPDKRGQTSQEIKALESLTDAKCFCTPKFKAWKHENQNPDGWVPGGFLDYIVMEKLEGRTLSLEFILSLGNEQQRRSRTAFKRSYIECLNHNFVNLDQHAQNLIWNEDKGICYIIDWESWCRARPAYAWNDNEYCSWALELS